MASESETAGSDATVPAGTPAPATTPAEPPVLKQPATPGAKKVIPRAPRKWNLPQQSKISNKAVWTLVAFSSVMVAVFGILIGELAMPRATDGPPALGPEFKHNDNAIIIRPPLNWTIVDPHDQWNIFIKGPAVDHGFPPLLIASLEIAPGRMSSYIKEHKARIEAENKTVKWISEQDHMIDNAHAVRLEFDCEMPLENEKNPDGSPKMGVVRSLQYVMEDSPRFYRVTAHVRADLYQKYLSRFEASAHSFKRMPPVVFGQNAKPEPAPEKK
jgi:hypothetical protein